jgi:heme/copper-type cytochrome/quinol oxidase subunit 2
VVIRSAFWWAAAGYCLLTANVALADDAAFKLTIRNHRFEPAELVVPAGQKIKLEIKNLDATPEEFESHELNREKVVPANATVVIFVGPLKPGRYPFFGDFNKDSAKGVLIAK